MTYFVAISGAGLIICSFCILGLAVVATSDPAWMFMVTQLGVFGGITLESFMQVSLSFSLFTLLYSCIYAT